jgi:hypothetical protein
MDPLFALLKSAPDQIDSLSITQIVPLCGNGKLSDSSTCSSQLREYFNIAKSENLAKYLETCLDTPFERSGFVLQDIVNEFGRRLDYSVENGLYQGKAKAIGFDGLWTNSIGHEIVVEVKTTDAYRINLDVITRYQENMVALGKISKGASVLIVVGREDTGDLEAQVRGSRHAWTVRLISTDALVKLVGLKESGDSNSIGRIHELLRPFEYTKLDRIIEIVFAVTEDATSLLIEQEAVESDPTPPNPTTISTHLQTSPQIISEIRDLIINTLIQKFLPLVKKSRALYWTADQTLRVAVTISKQYADGDYWYAYHSAWDVFLSEAITGLYVLGCVGREEAYAIPYEWIHSRIPYLHFTERDGERHWHILLYSTQANQLTLRLNNGTSEALEGFKISLAKNV